MRKSFIAAMASVSILSFSTVKADVEIGYMMGFTGAAAEPVAKISNAAELARKMINDQGGLFAGGENLQLVTGDSACDPVAAVDAAKKLVDVSQVVGIVGPTCSGAAIASAESVTIPAGVVNIGVSSTSPAITTIEDQTGTDVVFRVAPSDSFQGVTLAKLAWDKGIKKIAIMASNDDYNEAISRVFEKAFKDLGGEIAAFQRFDPGKNSYRSEVTTLRKSSENLALFAYFGNGGIIILRNSIETNPFKNVVGADSMRNQAVIDQLGAENLKGVTFTTSASDEASEGYKAWKKLSDAEGLDPGQAWMSHTFDAVFLMALAIEKAGSKDRTKISAALREIANAPGEIILPGEWAKAKKILADGGDIHYRGGSGLVDFDEKGDVTGVYSASTVSKDGKWDAVVIK